MLINGSLLIWLASLSSNEVSVAALGGSTTEHTFFCGYQPGWVRCVSRVSVELRYISDMKSVGMEFCRFWRYFGFSSFGRFFLDQDGLQSVG